MHIFLFIALKKSFQSVVMGHTNQQLLNGHPQLPNKGFAASDTKLILVTDAAGITYWDCKSATCPISVKLRYYKEATHDYYYENKDLTYLVTIIVVLT